MASILSTSLLGGKKINESAGSDAHLSKVVELGGSYRIFMRKLVTEYGQDLAAGLVPGRVLNADVFKSGFVPFKKDMFEADEQGNIKDLTGLDSWARMARVLHDAQCTREKKNAEAEAERAASELGVPVDQVALKRTLSGIEEKYHGGETANGDRIYPKVQPLISGIKRKMTTRIAVVKLGPTGAPDWKSATYAIWELSNSRIQELANVLSQANYVNEGKDYIELGYMYMGADKKTAGKNAKLDGIVQQMSLEVMYPQEWEQAGRQFIENLTSGNTPDDIADFLISRNRNLKGGKSPKDIISTMKLWCANNAAVFSSIDYESEAVEWAAKDFLASHLVDTLPKVKESFEKIVAEQEAQKNGEEEENIAGTLQQEEQEAIKDAARLADAGQARSVMDVASTESGTDFEGDLGDLDD